MKTLLLLSLLLAGLCDLATPAQAAIGTTNKGYPTNLERNRRRLHRHAMMRVRQYKRLH